MEYKLIRSGRKTAAIQIVGGEVIVRAPNRMPLTEINAFVSSHQRWIEEKLAKQKELKQASEALPKLSYEEIKELADAALELIPKRVQHYAEILGVSYGNITVRNQRTRWGSCSGKHNLNFNCLLMLAPREVLDAIVVHELCHIKEMNHSKAFYNLVESVYPDYKIWDKWLKENGQLLLSRMI